MTKKTLEDPTTIDDAATAIDDPETADNPGTIEVYILYWCAVALQ